MAYDRIYNFSAGPSILPEAALETARDEMMNYRGSGMSVMEMSHRSKVFDDIFQSTKAKLRKALCIPEEYTILFLQGGASSQFSMHPPEPDRKDRPGGLRHHRQLRQSGL